GRLAVELPPSLRASRRGVVPVGSLYRWLADLWLAVFASGGGCALPRVFFERSRQARGTPRRRGRRGPSRRRGDPSPRRVHPPRASGEPGSHTGYVAGDVGRADGELRAPERLTLAELRRDLHTLGCPDRVPQRLSALPGARDAPGATSRGARTPRPARSREHRGPVPAPRWTTDAGLLSLAATVS